MKMLRACVALLALWASLAYGQATLCPGGAGFESGIWNGTGDGTTDLNVWAYCDTFNTANTGRIRLHERLALTDAWASGASGTTSFIDISPVMTATTGLNVKMFNIGGTFNQTAVGAGSSLYNGYSISTAAKSSVATIQPPQMMALRNVGTLLCDNVACGTSTSVYGIWDEPILQAHGASGSWTVTDYTEIQLEPIMDTDNASASLTLTNRRGINCLNPSNSGAGTEAITTNGCFDIQDQTLGTNAYGLRSAITSGANKYFLKDDGGAQSKLTGKFTTYNATTTAGFGLATVVAAGRFTAQTAAKASVATFTVGASDGTFRVSANVLVTTSTVHSFTATCAYTDEGNTARTITLNFSTLAGVISNAGIANAAGAVPYAGVPLHIRAKSGTAITIATTGTFTTVTYNVEGLIEQLA